MTSALISTQALAEIIGDPRIRLLDASYYLPAQNREPRSEYAAGHLADAVFFDIDEISDPSTGLPHMLPSSKVFAQKVGALGVGNDHTVVVYDTTPMFGAARAWWMFRVFGHDQVRVLDGGLPKWIREGRPVTSAPAARAACPFEARMNPAGVADAQEMMRRISKQGQIVDARTAARFEGTTPEPRPGLRLGHMPGARNVPFGDLISPETGCLLDTDELRSRFARAAVDPSRATIATCGSGITACIVALGLHEIGARDVAVYDGSWAEWGARDDMPIVTGPAEPAPAADAEHLKDGPLP